MSLEKYHQKRNFQKTAEPYGKTEKKTKNLYLIQKHAASHLHYDFRLELNGVLKSWAVPKGPSLDPAVKRLAVHVEDHPVAYGHFEGTIPQGEYGGGTVMLWDTGTWQCLDPDPAQAYKKGHLKFLLKGKKLKGHWKLVQIKNDPKNWLLMKADDQYADVEIDITVSKDKSVTTKRDMDQIAQAGDKKWRSHRSLKKSAENKQSSTMPQSIQPQLATLVASVPPGAHWLHEIKFDGYRLLAFIENKNVRLMTRGQQNWTHKFPKLVAALKKLRLKNAIFDGEVVALNHKNNPDFQLLQNTLNEEKDNCLHYYIFDLLYLNSENLLQLPLIERKQKLGSILPKQSKLIHYSDHIIGQAHDMHQQACQLGLEGIISKDSRRPYTQKRSKDWLKIKCVHRQEFIIIGYTKPSGKRLHFGSLLLAYHDKKGQLQFCGHVGTGFTDKSLRDVFAKMQKYKIKTCPLKKRPAGTLHVSWLKPVLMAEIEFTEWTEEKSLRHPSFKGLRQDKAPQSITIERAIPMNKTKPSQPVKSITLTHPDKILYPKAKISKQRLADYYESIADIMLPYVINRPLSLVRCPAGSEKSCFFQKHVNENVPHLYQVAIKESEKKANYSYIKDVNGLLSLVQLGVLEIHTWNCHVDQVEKPDMIIFDLDPAPDVAYKQVVATAFLLREKLLELKLESFVKTTGGKGLHVVVPIARQYSWEQIKTFSHAFVELIVQLYPDHYVSKMTKSLRKGKIFIDYLRNQRGATSIAPYSARKHPNATLAIPLAWTELTTKIKPDAFTVKNIYKRLNDFEDPWQGFAEMKQKLITHF